MRVLFSGSLLILVLTAYLGSLAVPIFAHAQSVINLPRRGPITGPPFERLSSSKILVPKGLPGLSLGALKNEGLSNPKTLRNQNEMKLGGDISGGSGTTLLRNGKRTFLDLDIADFENKGCCFSAGSFLSTENWGSGRIQRVDLQKTELGPIVQLAIRQLSQISPVLEQSLLQIYKSLPFYFVNGNFKILDTNFYIPKEFFARYEDALISTTALNMKGIGILISRQQFAEMDSQHQSALILHELLRSMQIQFAVSLSNFEIQQITASFFQDKLRLEKSLGESQLGRVIKNSRHKISLKSEFCRISQILNSKIGSAVAVGICDPVVGSSISYFDLADAAAGLSLTLLEFRIGLRSKPQMEQYDPQIIESYEDQLDSIVANARGSGVAVIGAKSLSAMAELQGSFLSNQFEFISACGQESEISKPCFDFTAILNQLIE